MSIRETRAFLASHHHGVLSLGMENRGYGFPVSYTFDHEHDRLVLGFVTPPESKKQAFAEATDEATFSVFTFEDVDTWKSVVVTGPLMPLDEGDHTHQVPDIFFQPEDEDGTDDNPMVSLDSFERTWYELRIDTLSGRYSGRESNMEFI